MLWARLLLSLLSGGGSQSLSTAPSAPVSVSKGASNPTMLWAGLLLSVLSGVSAAPVSVSVRFGGSVSLPCDGSAYRGAPVGSLSLLWQTPARRVWAFRQGRAAPGPGFENRTEVSRDGLPRGDFSLSLHRARLSDEDTYECFREGEDGSRTFLGDVRLTVVAHSLNLSLYPGLPLSVPLPSGEPVEVLSNPEGGRGPITVLTLERGWVSFEPQYHTRVLVKHEVMTLYGLTPADQGTYTVLQLDTRRALSTVQLTVHARRENATLPAGADLSIPLLSGAGDAQVRFEPAGAGGVAEPVFALRGGRVRLRLQYQLRVRRQPGALLLSGVTPADQGTYSLWQMDTERLLSSVQLSVEARRDNVTLQAGASLSVPLLTGEPVEVLFDPAGSGDWTSVCSVQSSTASCVPQYRDRVSVDNQELRLQELRASDQGSYTVRDLQGNTISTVIVTVTVEAPPPGQSSGLVAGTVVGVLTLLVLVAGGLLLWGRRKRRRRRAEKAKRPDFRLQCRASPDQEEELSAEAEHRGQGDPLAGIQSGQGALLSTEGGGGGEQATQPCG